MAFSAQSIRSFISTTRVTNHSMSPLILFEVLTLVMLEVVEHIENRTRRWTSRRPHWSCHEGWVAGVTVMLWSWWSCPIWTPGRHLYICRPFASAPQLALTRTLTETLAVVLHSMMFQPFWESNMLWFVTQVVDVRNEKIEQKKLPEHKRWTVSR